MYCCGEEMVIRERPRRITSKDEPGFSEGGYWGPFTRDTWGMGAGLLFTFSMLFIAANYDEVKRYAGFGQKSTSDAVMRRYDDNENGVLEEGELERYMETNKLLEVDSSREGN